MQVTNDNYDTATCDRAIRKSLLNNHPTCCYYYLVLLSHRGLYIIAFLVFWRLCIKRALGYLGSRTRLTKINQKKKLKTKRDRSEVCKSIRGLGHIRCL